MLFKKRNSTPNKSLGNITIIGDSPLAFFLSCLLQNNSYKVSFLVSPQNTKKHEHQNIKTTSFRLGSFSNFYTDSLPATDYCVIASSPKNYKTDFLLSQTPSLKDVPILNFSHLYNHHLFEESANKKIIPAYYTGWINFEKNTIETLSQKIVLKICCPLKGLGTYENLFKDPSTEIKGISPSKPSFWQHLIPFLLSNLLLVAYKEDIITTLNQKDLRDLISAALNELCSLAEKDGETIKKSDILAFLYTVPSQYKSEFLEEENRAFLSSMLPQISYFDTPALYKLFSLGNKY